MSSMFPIRFYASRFHRLCDFVLICSCSVFNYFLAFRPLRNFIAIRSRRLRFQYVNVLFFLSLSIILNYEFFIVIMNYES